MSVKAQPEKNFRRAKVKPAKRKGARPWFTWRGARLVACLLVVLYAGYRGFDLVVSASTLQVRRITVHGNVRLSSGEVQALVDGLRGTNILTADLSAYRQKLLDSPWVADVAMRRFLPSTVEVFVSERDPIGICRLRGQFYLVDRSGTLIDEFGPQYSEFDLPIIDGLVRTPSKGEPIIDERRAELAARVIESVAARKDLAARLSQIDVSDVRDAVVMLQGDATLLHVGEEKFLERLQSYVDVAPVLREQVPDMDYVDLRFGKRVAVGPSGAGGRPATAGKPVVKKF